jgi:hypothetical protein
MSAAQQTSLLSLSPDPVYQQSVNNLFTPGLCTQPALRALIPLE